MALADYYERAELAASQVLGGFSVGAFRSRLENICVRLSFGQDAADSAEGQALLDLTVRLLSRLYPVVQVRSGADTTVLNLERLAVAINPAIELRSQLDATHEIVIGAGTKGVAPWTIHAGSSGWIAHLSRSEPQSLGTTSNPFGAGAGATLACAALFRAVFADDHADQNQDVDVWAAVSQSAHPSLGEPFDIPETVLAGAGAVGNAALWTLQRTNVRGRVHVVDPQTVELSNVQRYVLASRADVGRPKVELMSSGGTLTITPHAQSLNEFLQQEGHNWNLMLLGLDSAEDRCRAQAALPRRIANAWTQIGDLGVSTHDFLRDACVSCLYMPAGSTPSEDQIVADALGVTDRVAEVRDLLYRGEPVPDGILDLVGERLAIDVDLLERFRGKPIRALYVDGVCGGALLPLGSRTPDATTQVPLAHQSALAGVLLGAASIALSKPSPGSWATRLDVMRTVSQPHRLPLQKDSRGLCYCQDADYVDRYRAKWPSKN